MMAVTDNKLTFFGFSTERGGAHTSRTIMLEELRKLLSYIDHPEAQKAEYLHAIDEKNCLGKRSAKTRLLTYRHLVDLYALDPSIILYRALLYFWKRDSAGQPLIAMLCAYARDAIVRSSAFFIMEHPEGSIVSRDALEKVIDAKEPGRFSKATLKSTAQNINASWTKSGHLKGRAQKIRCRAIPTPGSVAYALLLGYLSGIRGEALLRSDYVKLLECSFDEAVQLAEAASRKGWIVFKRIGSVIEVQFPNLINDLEKEWIREQS